MLNVIIAYSKNYYKNIIQTLNKNMTKLNVYEINTKEQLTSEFIKKINPRYIFFPHWSYIIPKEIYTQYECIVFHMTDLPFGRGGSPLQNLISRGVYETKVSALQCVEELDAGPIYMKMPLSLHGNAEEIYIRASKIIRNMIEFIISNSPEPITQFGEITTFKRRRLEESNLCEIEDLVKIYDYIRMLDATGYPNAYIETGFLKLEFTRASLKTEYIIADVKITKRNDL